MVSFMTPERGGIEVQRRGPTAARRRAATRVKWGVALGLLFAFNFEPGHLVVAGLYGDDASYFAHATTIALDFDLDYSNEHFQVWNAARTIAAHPIGAGVLAAPFVGLFGVIDRITHHPIIHDHEKLQYSWSYFGFLFAANFYFFLGVFLFWRGVRRLEPELDIRWNLLLAAGTGVVYYVLRQFTMAHAFEFAALGLVFWASAGLYDAFRERKRIAGWVLLCGLGISLSLAIRNSNLVVMVLPHAVLLCFHLMRGRGGILEPRQLRSALGIVSVAAAAAYLPIALFNLHFYGTVFPSVIARYGYDVKGLAAASAWTLATGSLRLVPNLVPLLFSSEFGLVFTNPVLVIGCTALIVLTFHDSLTRRNGVAHLAGWVFLGVVAFSVAVVLWWRTTASSYGYRYLFPLYPFALLGFALLLRRVADRGASRPCIRRAFSSAVVSLCAVAFISQLFFGVNERLSTRNTVNVFGVLHTYSAKGYLTNLLGEIARPETWVRLAATRYAGFLAGPIVIHTSLYERIAEADRDKYERRFGHVPWTVYLQTLLLFAGWVAVGVVVGSVVTRAPPTRPAPAIDVTPRARLDGERSARAHRAGQAGRNVV